MEFPAGITAIVGPNGSGKSNVVDAIRWLLGEREAKNLRGAKVEDLIFAGTPKRPRLSQAQASLHFDNKNKFFPVDFAEVSVMRQVSRDGVSSYFLNKSEILLRDLIDFFAKARLGSRGLVVITQGNSDIFIQANPGGRREMIEEILGLREYQLKKSDAERRLKNSQINLDKVKALLEEILPHLRSLKRQTNKWEKRGAIEEELRSLENKFFGYKQNGIQEEVLLLERGLNVEREKLERLKEKKRSAESHEKEVEAAQPKEREELRQIKEKTQKLLDERSRLQKELGRLEARIELGRMSGAPLKLPAVDKLIGLVKKVKNRLEGAVKKEIGELREAVKDAIKEIDLALALEAKEGSTVSVPADLRSNLEKTNEELLTIGNEILKLKENEKALEKSQEQFYQAFKAAVGAVQAANDEIEKWETENQKRLFEKERLELRLEELRRQMIQAGRIPDEFKEIKIDEVLSEQDLSFIEKRIFKLRGDLASIGEIDEALMKEAKETENRYQFLSRESEDLEEAVKDLTGLIRDLSEKLKTEFEAALVKINEEFNKFFSLMFDGGHAKLKIEKLKMKNEKFGEGNEEGLSEENVPDKNEVAEEEGGVDIEIRLPRKRINSLEMLSGGERSLVGIAALFALISVSPPPFLVLDEIDAALDDRNARRFAEVLNEFSKQTQFVVVTHNRATMEVADVLYGITLDGDGTSKLLSLKLKS